MAIDNFTEDFPAEGLQMALKEENGLNDQKEEEKRNYVEDDGEMQEIKSQINSLATTVKSIFIAVLLPQLILPLKLC